MTNKGVKQSLFGLATVLYSLMFAGFVYLILDAAQRVPDIGPEGKVVVWFVLSALMVSILGLAIVLASF